MVATGGDGGDPGQPGRNRGLAVAVVAPRHDGAVVLERETVRRSGGDGSDSGQPRRNRDLAEAVVAPRHDGAVVLERETVGVPGRNGGDPGEPGWNRDLTRRVAAPAGNKTAAEPQAMVATHRDRCHTAGIQRQSCLSDAIVTPRIKVGIRGREPLHHRIGGIHGLETIPPGSRAGDFSAADGPHIEPLIEKHPPGVSRRRIIGKQQPIVAASDAIDFPAGQADGGIVRGDEPIPDRKQLAVGQGTMADLNRRVHTVCRKGDPMKRLQAPGILGQNLDLHIAEIHRPIGGGIPRKPEGCVSRTVQPEVRARPLHKRAQLHNAAKIVQTVQESQRRRLHGCVIGIDNLVVDVHE